VGGNTFEVRFVAMNGHRNDIPHPPSHKDCKKANVCRISSASVCIVGSLEEA
jgi:hypothetical protein